MPWARRTTVAVAVLAAVHVVAAVGLLADAPSRRSWIVAGLMVAVVPLTPALSMLVARRDDGAVVGTLLGLLSLSVADVATKEIWLDWLAATGRADEWAWLVALTAEDAWWVLA